VSLAFGVEADSEQIATTTVVDDETAPAVDVPPVDSDELSSFFITSASISLPLDPQDKEEASIDTFNDIFIDSNDMYVALHFVWLSRIILSVCCFLAGFLSSIWAAYLLQAHYE